MQCIPFRCCGGANGGGLHALLCLIIMYGELKTVRNSHLPEVLQHQKLQIIARVHEIDRLIQVHVHTVRELLTVFEGSTQCKRTIVDHILSHGTIMTLLDPFLYILLGGRPCI